MPIIFWWILYTRFVGILCDIKWKYASLINTRLNTVAVQFLSRIKLETIITSHRMTQTSRLQASMHFIVISPFSYMNPIFELISSEKFLNFYRQQKYLVGFSPFFQSSCPWSYLCTYMFCSEISSKSLFFIKSFYGWIFYGII